MTWISRDARVIILSAILYVLLTIGLFNGNIELRIAMSIHLFLMAVAWKPLRSRYNWVPFFYLYTIANLYAVSLFHGQTEDLDPRIPIALFVGFVMSMFTMHPKKETERLRLSPESREQITHDDEDEVQGEILEKLFGQKSKNAEYKLYIQRLLSDDYEDDYYRLHKFDWLDDMIREHDFVGSNDFVSSPFKHD